jgi:hypothetical protein
MAAQLAGKIPAGIDERNDAPRRNWFYLTKGFKRHDAWRTLTPSHRVIFFTILDIANEFWFPDSVTLYEAEIAEESSTSMRSVKRALEELRDAGVLHFGTAEEDKDRRIAVRIRIDYAALTRCGKRQSAGVASRKSANCRHEVGETLSERGSPISQVQLQKEQRSCPDGQLRVPEVVGGGMQEGDLCPKCGTHRLSVRFKTDAGSRTKQRFLACLGHSAGACRGFTWNLGSTAYEPSRRVLLQAQVGARHVPGRPALVRDVLTAAQQAVESAPTPNTARMTLAEWYSKSSYLPVALMLSSLVDVAPDLATRHRDQGSDKGAILRDVKARIGQDGS